MYIVYKELGYKGSTQNKPNFALNQNQQNRHSDMITVKPRCSTDLVSMHWYHWHNYVQEPKKCKNKKK